MVALQPPNWQQNYKKATQSVKKIILCFSKTILFIDQGQQIPTLIFRQILPWIIIAICLKNGEISISLQEEAL